MALIKTPVTGMKDILPKEMEIRNYVISQIQETYASFGFSQMETPCVEHIENLCSKQGGENEKLIFKILKRGEKLNVEAATTEAEVVDGGLRYDQTLPLARYYANNNKDLLGPFKALNIGNVWRADRPQKGRFRQFMQCDIDILGESTNIAEIELILATSTLLGKIGFKNFTIRINDRRFLKAMAAYSGFEEKDYDDIFITLDKMDKIGLSGVKEELLASGYEAESVEKYLDLFANVTGDLKGVSYLKETLGDFLPADCAEGLSEIMEAVDQTRTAEFKTLFDPTLVRGMSYYTGTIFEISMDEFGSSVGGGGRYDEMIGRFTGQDVPACGFSIGFERIVMLLMERDFKVPTAKEKVALLLEKNLSSEKKIEALRDAKELREAGKSVFLTVMKKNKKFQKTQLGEHGYTEFKEYFNR